MKKLAIPFALALLLICVQILAPPPASAQGGYSTDFDPVDQYWTLRSVNTGTHDGRAVIWQNNIVPADADLWFTHPGGTANVDVTVWRLVGTAYLSVQFFDENSQIAGGAQCPIFGTSSPDGEDGWVTLSSVCTFPTAGNYRMRIGFYHTEWYGSAFVDSVTISAITPITPPTGSTPTPTATSTPIPTATYTPTPEPTYEPTVINSLDPRGSIRGSLPIGDPNQGGPLPGPVYIPPPDPLVQELTEPLWEYDNLRGMFSMVQTLWVLAEQNFFISAFLTLGVLTMAVVWLVNTVKSTGQNL